MKKTLGFLFAGIMSGHVFAIADAGNINIDPSYLKIKVYKMAVSTSPLCTNLIEVINETNPEYKDVLQNPDFGSGQLSDGTYPCVVIEFSDVIKYKPNTDSTSGNCLSANEETSSVCQAGATSTLVDGTSVTCTSGEDRVAMYLSTTSTATNGGSGHTAFLAPTQTSDSTKGFKLSESLIVEGTSVGKFVVNGTDKVCDGTDDNCDGNAGACEMMPPLFSFSKE